ncbi:outer membrane protein assembly factor BamD [Candidatus Cardinium sp. cByotN1]|uniref:outer membrane protein assembly factor BamD n=1 Tax=Candidatus Cardinium sp. cByotN1 TaxID=2699439 RepID=UPI001FB3EF60|nr:outer membrane protein assembly factor BamD [Candidatus Cardinium sp. cByotN1]
MKNYKINSLFMHKYSSLFLLLLSLLGHHVNLFANPASNISQPLILQKQQAILELYEKKHYARANEAIELLLPLLKNRIERAKFEYYQAYCNFHQKRYLVSANQFHLLVKQYPAFPQVEEALFMQGYSLAFENVDIRLDQTTTYDAMRCLEHYLAVYPTGAYLDKASDALQKLQGRLMQKSFEAAALYVRLGYYNAAIVAIKNFQQAYPESAFKEKALRLLIKCYQKLALAASHKEKKKQMKLYSDQCAQQLAEHFNDKKVNLVEKARSK